MRRIIVILSAVAVSLAFTFAPPPDTIVRGRTVYARRGSLGANDYVATNVVECSPSYALCVAADGRLRDRAINSVETGGDVYLAVPTNDSPTGMSRTFCVYLRTTGNAGCRVMVAGARRLVAPSGSDGLVFGKGEFFLAFAEIEEDVFMVDTRVLTEE